MGTPKINKSKKKIASANSRLYNPTKDIQELEERKIAMELEGCTFQPKISKRSQSTPRSRPSMAPGKGNFHDRLYAAGKENQERRDKAIAEAQQKELSMFTFKPDISAGAAGETLTRQSGSSEPVHERLYLAGRKEDLIFKMKPLQEQLDKDLTFKPTLNARSQSVGKLRSSASIYDRLHSEHAINQEQIERNEEMRISKELEGCTYRPYISERSRSVGRMRPEDGGDIFERLYPKPDDDDADTDEENVIVTKV